ncbi:MAG TPA: glycosyltransferase family 1 protein [Candidatus Moranbacteria bacterium]|nr:glycosyltransferase family 1 protein [Candidatus Moranbacteria bacterium]
MRIAVQAADLDSSRIDGTRVYILNLLKEFGRLDDSSQFLIYHKNTFNPELVPPDYKNYKIIKKDFPFLWTQTRFSWEIIKDNPDVLWMPMQALPMIRKKKLKTVITVHDLAFKYFPRFFPAKDLRRLNFYGDYAIGNANKIIAISQSTKDDILKFYPAVGEDKIKVISHGFDRAVYEKPRNMEKEAEVKKKYKIEGNYLIYIGAIQPRKNLEKLVEAFDLVKEVFSDLKLVLAGEKAWLSEGVFEKIRKSPHKKDIICPGQVNFEDSGHLLRGALVFVFPSLYEGFGIPVLEAFASRVPVICSKNSSLPEVGGEAAVYFEDNDAKDLAEKIKEVMNDENLKQAHIAKGLEQIKKFSWEKCAQETLKYLKER